MLNCKRRQAEQKPQSKEADIIEASVTLIFVWNQMPWLSIK